MQTKQHLREHHAMGSNSSAETGASVKIKRILNTKTILVLVFGFQYLKIKKKLKTYKPDELSTLVLGLQPTVLAMLPVLTFLSSQRESKNQAGPVSTRRRRKGTASPL